MGRSAVEIEIRDPVPEGLTVFETMRQEADGSVALWPLHLQRLRRDCRAVGFPLDEVGVADALQGAPGAVTRLRLAVGTTGRAEVTRARMPPRPDQWRVVLSQHRLDSTDPWLRIKTSQRPVYDAARAALPPGMDEAILLNERGEVCEGTITSLFLRRDAQLLTPPLACGLLPGVLRQSLLNAGRAVVAVLLPDDLATGDLLMGNALRGLIPARLATA